MQFPPEWYGPDVVEWEQGIRLEVGSDIVYPYGTDRLDRIYKVTDSYYVVIQYTKNSQKWTLDQYRANQPWIETYLSVRELKDGESLSGPRDLVTRIGAFQLGPFEGVEYISTLSDTAQAEYYYVRQVVLFDNDLNALVVTGTPNNVQVANTDQWREAYRQVDATNLDVFHTILDLIVFN